MFICKGRANTCIKKACEGGLCCGCGAGTPKCKHPGCSNKRRRGGLCVDHGAKHPRCTGFNDDGTPCTNKARKDRLCRRHGARSSICPCGKQRYYCPKCNPLGHLRGLIKMQVRLCSPRFTTNKGPPSKAPDCLGCTGEEYDVYIESHFQDGMTWDNYGHGKGKWTIDHTLAYFSEPTPATTKEEVLRRSHYTNTKPMWFTDNLSKGIKGT